MKNRFGYVLGILATLAVAVTDVPAAHAAGPANGTVAAVQYDSGRLTLAIGGTYYYGYGTGWGANCATYEADTLKVWESMALAAMLAGKRIEVNYGDSTTCQPGATVKMIYNVRVIN